MLLQMIICIVKCFVDGNMKKYCVEFNYNCCSHYVVDAVNEDEAIEKASELDWKLKRKDREEWYDNLDIELDETQVWEERP